MPFTDREKEEIIESFCDQNKVNLYCGMHSYFGPGNSNAIKPTSGCADCWKVYYTHVLASTPPHMREQRLEELEAAVYHACEQEDAGLYDFIPFEHPSVSIEKE